MSNTQMANMADLAKGLQKSAQAVDSGGGNFMKFAKGEWTWGAEETEVEEDALWAIHPNGFQHGYIAWGDKENNNKGTKLGETMVDATLPLPFEADLPEVKGSWAQQISMQMVCLSGMDKGTKLTFNSCSTGGRKAYGEILNAVVAEIVAGNEGVCPAVLLGADHYKHKDHGKVYTPSITIKSFKTLADLNGILAAMEDGDDEPVEEVKKIAKKKVKKVVEKTEVVEEEDETKEEMKARMKAEMKAELAAEAKEEAAAEEEAKAEAAAKAEAESPDPEATVENDEPAPRRRRSRR